MNTVPYIENTFDLNNNNNNNNLCLITLKIVLYLSSINKKSKWFIFCHKENENYTKIKNYPRQPLPLLLRGLFYNFSKLHIRYVYLTSRIPKAKVNPNMRELRKVAEEKKKKKKLIALTIIKNQLYIRMFFFFSLL